MDAADVPRLRSITDVTGIARVDRRTKDLIKRLEPGEIAVIDHEDLDRVAADGLIEAKVVAVVNAALSISGRYPNGGPIRVVEAGIPLIDGVGSDLLDRVAEGDRLHIVGGEIWRADELLATGNVAQRRRNRSRDGDSPGPRSAPSSSGSRPTPSSTSAKKRGCRSSRSRCRRCAPRSAVAMHSSSCAVTTTATTCSRCARTSASTGRCSSVSTAAPTR